MVLFKRKLGHIRIFKVYKYLVKDEFLAAVRDDLADDYSSSYKEAPSRLTEAGRKYLAERVSVSNDTVAERHLRFSSNKNLM